MSAAVHDATMLTMMVDMGFAMEESREALLNTDNQLRQAIDLVVAQQESQQSASLPPPSYPTATTTTNTNTTTPTVTSTNPFLSPPASASSASATSSPSFNAPPPYHFPTSSSPSPSTSTSTSVSTASSRSRSRSRMLEQQHRRTQSQLPRLGQTQPSSQATLVPPHSSVPSSSSDVSSYSTSGGAYASPSTKLLSASSSSHTINNGAGVGPAHTASGSSPDLVMNELDRLMTKALSLHSRRLALDQMESNLLHPSASFSATTTSGNTPTSSSTRNVPMQWKPPTTTLSPPHSSSSIAFSPPIPSPKTKPPLPRTLPPKMRVSANHALLQSPKKQTGELAQRLANLRKLNSSREASSFSPHRSDPDRQRLHLDLSSASPLALREISKIDRQFGKQLQVHSGDAPALVFGHLLMILAIPNHPVTMKADFVNWSRNWFSPYARIETPTSGTISNVSEIIFAQCSILYQYSLEHYAILNTSEHLQNISRAAVNDIIWSFVYEHFIELMRKANQKEDARLNHSMAKLRTLPLSKYDIRRQFWLENDPLPYGSAVTSLRNMQHATNAETKLACLVTCASKVVKAVTDYWSLQTLEDGEKPPSTSVGGDELLPLITYVVIQARIPHLQTEISFIELLIDDAAAIEQEGYLLATIQTSLSLIDVLSKELDDNEDDASFP